MLQSAMPVKILEKETVGEVCYQNFECIPDGDNGSSTIRIKSDRVDTVGIGTFLEHQGSESFGFDCLKLDAINRRCNLNGQPCEQVPGAN
ncbi:MAG: hypothetical protein WC784_03030 [Candidatus Shapirobacteria bacterium]|jgi:hypothetical protein